MPAANRLFDVYELLYSIFSAIQLDGGASALLPLACVSHSVGSVALDLLWERQESLVPLFRVLPCIHSGHECYTQMDIREGIWKSFQVSSALTYYLEGPSSTIPLGQWERLLPYARRIKVLDYRPFLKHKYKDLAIDPSVLAAALRRCGDSVLLPNVHSLLLGPRMTDLRCYVVPIVRLAPEKDGPQTAYLSLKRLPVPRDLVSNICRLDALQVLAIPPSGKLDFLPALRDRRGLVELHLPEAGGLDSDDWYEHDCCFRAPPVTPGFHGLQTLRIPDPETLHCATRIMQNLSTEPLKLCELSITGWDHDCQESEAGVLYSAIRGACDATTLIRLAIVTHRFTERAPDVARKYFADLLAFPNITHAEIHFAYKNADVDGAFDAMTEAWPRLERLRFVNIHAGHDYREKYRKSSLGSLVHLGRRCPRLSSLDLELDLSIAPPPIVLAESLERRITLNVNHSKMRGDTDAIGLFLASVFPWPTL
ncbi:hypothetical protein BD626DRAFT_400666, partial [Schizophyllum amplum]